MELLLLFLFSLVSSHTIDCPIYACQKDTTVFSKDTCVYYDISTIPEHVYVRPCRSGDCLPTNQGNKTCQTPLTYLTKIYPGQKCNPQKYYCTLGCDSQNICQGKNSTDSCASHAQCNPGLRCAYNSTAQTDTCQDQATKGQGCLSDWDCQNGYSCLINGSSASQNTCNSVFSIKAGTTISADSCGPDNTSFLCENFYCGSDGNITKCMDKIMSQKKQPHKCYTNGSSFECLGTKDSQTGLVLETLCVCGYNDEGQGYCSPFLGDLVGEMLQEKMKSWLTNSENQKNCNTSRRLSQKCMQDWWDASNVAAYEYHYTNFYYYPLTVDLQNCVRDTLFPEVIYY